MALSTPISATLGEVNVGLLAALGFLNPLAIQIDALLAIGLGPLQAELAARLNASLAAQATLSIQISDPFANIKIFLAAIAQLQAALQAALVLQLPSISIAAELSAAASIAGSLSVQLGGLRLALQAALAVKIPALRALAQLTAHANAGPAFAFSFTGDDLAPSGADIAALFAAGLVDGGNTIAPFGEPVDGVVLLTKVPSVSASLFAIIQV